ASAPAGFEQPDFDDSTRRMGAAAFGSGSGCPLLQTVRTTWPASTHLLVRRELTLPCSPGSLQIFVAIDNDIEAIFVYVCQITGLNQYEECPQQDSLRFSGPASVLRPERNVVAYLLSNRGGNGCFDTRFLAASTVSSFDSEADIWTIAGDGT